MHVCKGKGNAGAKLKEAKGPKKLVIKYLYSDSYTVNIHISGLGWFYT